MGLILGGGGREQQKITVSDLCQSDRHFLVFVTQHVTSVTVSLIKVMVNKWNHCLLISRSSVRSRDGPPFKSIPTRVKVKSYFKHMYVKKLTSGGRNKILYKKNEVELCISCLVFIYPRSFYGSMRLFYANRGGLGKVMNEVIM